MPLKFLNACIGSVKDSVVGEERIAQYLLAVLNTRGTPLHWKHLNKRRLEGIRFDSEEKHEYKIKDLRPKRRKLPNNSDMIYVEVIWDPSHLFIFYLGWQKYLKTLYAHNMQLLGTHFKLCCFAPRF